MLLHTLYYLRPKRFLSYRHDLHPVNQSPHLRPGLKDPLSTNCQITHLLLKFSLMKLDIPRGGKISLLSFLFEVRSELKKVTFPSRPKIIRLSIIVIGASIIVAIYLGALDYFFVRLLELVLNK